MLVHVAEEIQLRYVDPMFGFKTFSEGSRGLQKSKALSFYAPAERDIEATQRSQCPGPDGKHYCSFLAGVDN